MPVDLYGPGFFSGRSEMVLPSVRVIVPMLNDYLGPVSVLDLGCGQGEWVEAFVALGVHAIGVDIASDSPRTTFRYDLTEPLYLGKAGSWDLVLCLETGEHLPESAADTLVDSCVRHAPSVVFSAAVPGQEGTGHINCQPHEYWHEKFAARGYEMFDPFRPVLAKEPYVKPWYKANIFLYEAI